MTKQTWQAARPNFDDYLVDFDNQPNSPFFNAITIQPRFVEALEHFCAGKQINKILTICASDHFLYRQLIKEAISHSNALTGNIILAESLDKKTLFGQYQVLSDGTVKQTQGLLAQANNGVLLIPVNLLLVNPALWFELKAAIQGAPVQKICTKGIVEQELTAETYHLNLVIIGDRFQLAELEAFDDSIRSHHFHYAEFEESLKLSKQSMSDYQSYIYGLADALELPTFFDRDAWLAFLQHAVRYSEDHTQLPLCPIWLQSHLIDFSLQSAGEPITQAHIQKALDKKYDRLSYLPMRALDDILDGSVIIETQGERVGQVNGLTVIEAAGHPISYGEPARISCVIHFGDGDVSDVERKAELGGNLHAKGMMIMQAFLSSALNLNEALPFSASIVFEQSYSEVDGDSASLAELCALVSALSETPVNQQIAVTGAVDQFGRVQAVGGLNEKIEGFFKVCQHQGLTGKQGVLIPSANLKHLSLHHSVVDALKNEQFHLWSVDSVDEAIEIIFAQKFRGDNDETILAKIASRIEQLDKYEPASCGLFITQWWQSLKNLTKKS